MSVLPPVSCEEAGIPAAMRELMKQPFSPIIDFYPADFGLDLNGKRFTWQAVVLLPFIDEPRMVRILGPLLKQLKPSEKVRNRRGNELVFGHKDDKTLFHAIQLAQAAFEAGHAGKKTRIGDNWFAGYLEGWQSGGAGRTVTSPIEGLPDVEESLAMSAQYTLPEGSQHMSKILPGAQELGLVVNASDMDEQARMKGFGGEPARRMIMQALGKDAFKKPSYKVPEQHKTPAAVPSKPAARFSKPAPAPAPIDTSHLAAQDDDGADDFSSYGGGAAPSMPTPPPGTKVIRIKSKKTR